MFKLMSTFICWKCPSHMSNCIRMYTVRDISWILVSFIRRWCPTLVGRSKFQTKIDAYCQQTAKCQLVSKILLLALCSVRLTARNWNRSRPTDVSLPNHGRFTVKTTVRFHWNVLFKFPVHCLTGNVMRTYWPVTRCISYRIGFAMQLMKIPWLIACCLMGSIPSDAIVLHRKIAL
jgi:hypothetical protein